MDGTESFIDLPARIAAGVDTGIDILQSAGFCMGYEKFRLAGTFAAGKGYAASGGMVIRFVFTDNVHDVFYGLAASRHRQRLTVADICAAAAGAAFGTADCHARAAPCKRLLRTGADALPAADAPRLPVHQLICSLLCCRVGAPFAF